MPDDDLALLEAWRAGDGRSGQRLVERHFDALYRFFANKVTAEIDDLIQETFMACVESLDRYRRESSFRTYLFAIARNKLFRYWRDRRSVSALETSVHQLAESSPTLADALVDREEQRLLLQALRTLPLELQVLLELAYFEGMTDREVAEVVELPVGTLKSRLRRGRQLLQRAMEEAAEPVLLRSVTAGFERWVASMRGRWQEVS